MHEIAPSSIVFEQEMALSPSACADMISLFESRPEQQHPGYSGAGESIGINTELKDSTDLYISDKGPEWAAIDQCLFNSFAAATGKLRDMFPALQQLGDFNDDGFQLQRTAVGQFHNWHSDCNAKDVSDRLLVAIWYLNDDFTGGVTEFKHQNISVKPETGKLILFPPWWTHWHKGHPVLSGTKYIATSWIMYA